VLSEIIQEFRTRYPLLLVTLETQITPVIVQDILARRADVGLVEGELALDAHQGLLAQELEAIPQYVVVGRRHDFWDRDDVSMCELDGKTFIMRQPASQSRIWLDCVLAQHGVTPRINAEFDNLESIKRTVAAGVGLAILPRYAIHDEETYGKLRAIAVEGVPLQRTVKLVWDGRRHFTPITRSLLEHLSRHYPSIGAVIRT
jgi:DNA-binding transcriptional LysR family regulator